MLEALQPLALPVVEVRQTKASYTLHLSLQVHGPSDSAGQRLLQGGGLSALPCPRLASACSDSPSPPAFYLHCSCCRWLLTPHPPLC